jgi:putative ABC transport system permease protein
MPVVFDRTLLRRLLRFRGFTAAVVLTIALAIAANTALFTIVHTVILRSLPFDRAEELLWVWNRRVDRDKAFYSIADFLDFRAQSRTIVAAAGVSGWGVNLTGAGAPEHLAGLRVTANALTVLGVRPALGRTLLEADGRPGAAKVVVVTHGLWQRQLGGDQGIVGRSLLLDGEAHTVAGVLPPEFFFPGMEGEILAPLTLETDPRRAQRDLNFMRMIVRRQPGATLQQVQEEFAAITERLKQIYPENAKKIAPRVLPLHREVQGDFRLALLILWGAVGLLLLVACANLAGLFVALAAQREREMAIRAALGASRARLVGQLLPEGVTLAFAGGVLGTALAFWATDFLLTLSPATLPRMTEIRPDATVLLFSLAVTLAAGVLLGLAPAVQYGRGDALETLRVAAGAGLRGAQRLRAALVVSQVALALTLCLAAAWMMRSFHHAQAVDPGLHTERLLLLRISLPGPAYAQVPAVAAFLEKLQLELRRIPGVEDASVASVAPLSALNNRLDFTIVGRDPASPDHIPGAQVRFVMPAFFETLGIPIVAGRGFEPRDSFDARPVAVVDRALAAQFFGGADPVGASLRLRGVERVVKIVGVAGNVKHFALDEEPLATLYIPIPQLFAPRFAFVRSGMSLIVRSGLESAALTEAVRRAVRRLDANIPASAPRTMAQVLTVALAPRRFNMQMLVAFAGTAVALATLGLYAVMACLVEQTRKEIGVRLALGALPRDIVKQVVRKSAALAATGVVLGLPLAWAAGRLAAGMLYRVEPADPATLATVAALLMATLLAASWVPARRAARTDPAVTLRQNWPPKADDFQAQGGNSSIDLGRRRPNNSPLGFLGPGGGVSHG